MHRFAASLLGLSLLTGCGFDPLFGLLAPKPGAGIVTGIIQYAGQPAAGKLVSLIGADQRVVSDANGRYTFRGVSAKVVQVRYVAQVDRDSLRPNEIESWISQRIDLSGGEGKEVPAFDVAYNGLLYPDRVVALVVSSKQFLPFHFSVHPQATRYRVKLYNSAKEQIWMSEWAWDPTAVFGKDVDPGSYFWRVEIDGGDRGLGTSRERGVDISPPTTG
jgi:hypothetical protein